MSKSIFFNKQAQEKLLKGLDICADAVSGTLGPKGRNAFIQRPYQNLITNDGATIADSIELEDKFEDMGAGIIRNVSAKTNDDCGDGTTTTALLTQAVIHECLKRPENPMEIRESLNEACKEAVRILKEKSKPATKEDLFAVAKISAENEQLAGMIIEVIQKLGEKAVINVQDSSDATSSVEVMPGYDAPVGYASPFFVNDKKTGKVVFDDVPVLVSEKKLSTFSDFKPLASLFEQENITQCVFVVDDIDDSMLGFLLKNHLGGVFKSVVIKAHGEVLEDIAAAVGATAIADRNGVTWQNVQLSDLGHADTVSVSANKSVFLGENASGELRAEELDGQAESEENQYRKAKLRDRAAKLRGGVGILKIGANSDYERDYLKLKAEDAIKAVQAAMEEGVVEGGGKALYDISFEVFESVDKDTPGRNVLRKAMRSPRRKINENAGYNPDENIVGVPDGVVDPAKVERCALENAVSAASSFITAFVAIVENAEPNQKQG